MKNLSKALVVVLLFALVLTLLPTLEAPASAATNPYVSFTNLSSQNPIMDMWLPFDTFKSGGPFTVTLESKVENVQGWTHPLTGATESNTNISIYVEGTVYATTTKQDANNTARSKLSDKGTGWQKSTFTFQNVGTINVSGNDIAGNLLRTYFWQTTGTVYLRNVKIVNAAGTTVYDMNTDPDLLGLASQMQASGMTESDISNVASINEDCWWCAPGSFGVAGDHYGTVHLDSGSSSNTTTSNRIPGGGTTTASTTKGSTTASTTKGSTTASTTKGSTTASTTAPVVTDPTIAPTTESTTAPTTEPTTAPTTAAPTTAAPTTTQQQTQQQGGGLVINPVAMVAFVLILVAGLCVVVLFATGAIGGKKKD